MSPEPVGQAGRGCVAITGATGMVGQHLCDHFRAAGWRVRALDRTTDGYPFRESGIERFACDLPDGIDPKGLAGADALIHLAYTTRFTGLAAAQRVNELGTARLLEAWRAGGGGKFVFISTSAARADALSYYARSKFAIEQTLDPARDLVIRPGLVLAARGEGLFQRIVGSMRRTHTAPVFDGGTQPIQTVYIDDLCAALLKAVTDGRSGTYTVAEPTGRPMREFLRLVSVRSGLPCRVISIPSAPVLALLRLAEALHLTLPVSSENVLGATGLVFRPSEADLRELGVEARSLEASLDHLLAAGPNG